MAITIDIRCARCSHFQSEHGTTGTHPCLAMVGDLLDRDFCPCDEFRSAAAQSGLQSRIGRNQGERSVTVAVPKGPEQLLRLFR